MSRKRTWMSPKSAGQGSWSQENSFKAEAEDKDPSPRELQSKCD